MEWEQRFSSFTSASFSVTNGLCQGCTIAPTLYLNQVIECWWDRKAWGVKVFYKHGGKLAATVPGVLRLLSYHLLMMVRWYVLLDKTWRRLLEYLMRLLQS